MIPRMTRAARSSSRVWPCSWRRTCYLQHFGRVIEGAVRSAPGSCRGGRAAHAAAVGGREASRLCVAGGVDLHEVGGLLEQAVLAAVSDDPLRGLGADAREERELGA